jgi:hypothetical protein
MRIFHRLAFEGYVNSSTSTMNFSDHRLAQDMGAVDVISIGGYAAQVTGTNPTLSIFAWGGFEPWFFQGIGVTFVSGVPLSTTQETLFQGIGPQPHTGYKFPFLAFSIQLGGTTPRAFLRIWVTGRDFSRRSKSIMQQMSDATALTSS